MDRLMLQVGKYYPPDTGGVEFVTEKIVEEFVASSGWKFETVVYASKLGGYEHRPGITRCWAPISISRSPLSLMYFIRVLRKSFVASTVLLHSPNPFAWIAVLPALLIRKPRLIVFWHNDVSFNNFLSKAFKPIEKRMLKRASAVIATSRRYAMTSESLSPVLNSVTVAHLGVPGGSVEKFEGGEDVDVLAVGRLVGYKGFVYLIEAMSMLPGRRLAIVGAGPLRGMLEETSYRYGVSDRVVFEGRVSERRLRELYSSAKLFCLPSISRSEGFGLVILEAFRYGLPVVCTDVPGSGMSEINEHMKTGLVVARENSEQLAAGIELLLSDEMMRERMAAEARRVFSHKYKVENMATRFESIFAPELVRKGGN